MKWIYRTLIAAELVALSTLAQPGSTNVPARVYSTDEAKLLIGETCTISGKVAQVTAREKVTYLNLEKPYPDMPFTGIIFAARTNLFGNLENLKAKAVLITGKITVYANTPQIVIDSQAQLTVLENPWPTEPGNYSSQQNPERAQPLAAGQLAPPDHQTDGVAKASAPGRMAGMNSSVAVWCIVGALAVITGLLTCLVIMLRRSGVGSPRSAITMALVAVPREQQQLAPGPASIPEGTEAVGRFKTQMARQKAVAELTEFAKQSLVQGLYSQRKDLLQTQQEAQLQLAALEARLASLHLPLQERIKAYEGRIAELESELDARGQDVRELTQATVLLIRERLEKVREESIKRFN